MRRGSVRPSVPRSLSGTPFSCRGFLLAAVCAKSAASLDSGRFLNLAGRCQQQNTIWERGSLTRTVRRNARAVRAHESHVGQASPRGRSAATVFIACKLRRCCAGKQAPSLTKRSGKIELQSRVKPQPHRLRAWQRRPAPAVSGSVFSVSSLARIFYPRP
jgi:hypothetical protein